MVKEWKFELMEHNLKVNILQVQKVAWENYNLVMEVHMKEIF